MFGPELDEHTNGKIRLVDLVAAFVQLLRQVQVQFLHMLYADVSRVDEGRQASICARSDFERDFAVQLNNAEAVEVFTREADIDEVCGSDHLYRC